MKDLSPRPFACHSVSSFTQEMKSKKECSLSNLILEQVEASGQEKLEEVNFERIFEEHFQEKFDDWGHLRQRFWQILHDGRRRHNIPCYKQEGLQSAVAAERRRRAEVSNR